jgi:hypothetical protein
VQKLSNLADVQALGCCSMDSHPPSLSAPRIRCVCEGLDMAVIRQNPLSPCHKNTLFLFTVKSGYKVIGYNATCSPRFK